MQPVTRRGFVEAVGATAGLGLLAPLAGAPAAETLAAAEPDQAVYLSGDGLGHYATRATRRCWALCQKADGREDTYLLGGEVEQFERHWAQLLGKERRCSCPPARWPTSWRCEALPVTGVASSCRR